MTHFPYIPKSFNSCCKLLCFCISPLGHITKEGHNGPFSQFDDANAMSLNAVSIKLPQLWTNRVRVWFAQVESQFTTKGISTSMTKYFYVVQALLEQTANRIPALL